ncbi:MAG: hypothetical protein LBI42_03465 [Chitinispirillales bacterium]|nr:hypothetical protein [Chitinispirillales bacterium]
MEKLQKDGVGGRRVYIKDLDTLICPVCPASDFDLPNGKNCRYQNNPEYCRERECLRQVSVDWRRTANSMTTTPLYFYYKIINNYGYIDGFILERGGLNDLIKSECISVTELDEIPWESAA